MKLIYAKTGVQVAVGDSVDIAREGEPAEIVSVETIEKPYKPSSSGRVYVKYSDGSTRSFFPSVIGAEWIERARNE